MVWVGLTRLHLHFNSLVSSQGPLPKEDPVGVCERFRGEEGGCTGLGEAETFAHRPSQGQRE